MKTKNSIVAIWVRQFVLQSLEIMHDIENERNMKKAIEAGHRMAMTTQRELIECLEEAKTTIENQSDRIGELLKAVERGNECREMLKRCEMWLSTITEGRTMQLECQRVLSLHNAKAMASADDKTPTKEPTL